MPYKALVLDIDGTLVSKKQGRASEACTAALNALQHRGVCVIIATGRAPFACTPGLAPGFDPNYKITANGAFITDALGKVLHEKRFDADNVQKLTQIATDNNIVLCFSFEDGYYFYSGYGRYLGSHAMPRGYTDYIKDGSARNRHLQTMPFGAYGMFGPDVADKMRAAYDKIHLMQSVSGAYDICRPEINKRAGIEMILADLSLTWADVVAVGDSENDFEMIKIAGLGVAMGDAPAGIKTIAGYVTGTADEDGVLQVIQKFF